MKDAADNKDIKNFETVWNEGYNACVACHQSARVPEAVFEVLREVGAEVEELAG